MSMPYRLFARATAATVSCGTVARADDAPKARLTPYERSADFPPADIGADDARCARWFTEVFCAAPLPADEAPLHLEEWLAHHDTTRAQLADGAAPERVVAVKAEDLALGCARARELAHGQPCERAAACRRVRRVRYAIQKCRVVAQP